MPKSAKGKSGRKPLSNISNSVCLSKRTKSSGKAARNDNAKDGSNDGSLSRLHDAHANLSQLIHQIDGLVVRAQKLDLENKLVGCDMECFVKVLLEMNLTLQAWLPKFEQTFGNLSAALEKQAVSSSPSVPLSVLKDENLISPDDFANKALKASLSPSPLVSWPAGIKNESERELFCLTPMPVSRTSCVRSKAFPPLQLTKPVDKDELSSMVKAPFSNSQNPNESPLQMEAATPQIPQSLVSKYSKSKLSEFSNEDPPRNSASPGLEMSPPKTCLLLRPVSESLQQGQDGFVESTPPLHVRFRKFDESPSSEELDSQIPKSLITKYPELFKKVARDSGPLNNQVQTSPHFEISPPKSCVLMMPSSEALLSSQGATEILQPHERDKALSDFISTFSPSIHCTEPGQTQAAIVQKEVTQEIWMDNHPTCPFEALPVPLLSSKLMHVKESIEESLESSCGRTFTSGGVQKEENILSDVTGPCDNIVPALPSLATPERTPIALKIVANAEQIDRQPGEQTLRRELWSKLEAESADVPFMFTTVCREARNDFLSMLDEMSLEENTRMNAVSQISSLHESFPLRKEGIHEDRSITLETSSTRISTCNMQGVQRSCPGDESHKAGYISASDPTERLQMGRLAKIDHIKSKASGMLLRTKQTCAHLKSSER